MSQEAYDKFVAVFRDKWVPHIEKANTAYSLATDLDPAEALNGDLVGNEMDALWNLMSDEEQAQSNWYGVKHNVTVAYNVLKEYLVSNPGKAQWKDMSNKGWAVGLSAWDHAAYEIEFLLSMMKRDYLDAERPSDGWLKDELNEREQCNKIGEQSGLEDRVPEPASGR